MDETHRILVVDDEEIVHSSVRRILSRMGYVVDGAFTAHEALKKMEADSYDAVITDLMMPEMNGIDMLYAMKERKINVPTIMITGYPTIKTAIQSLRLGAVDYIPKPFTRQELLSPLSRALRKGAASAENTQKAGAAEMEGRSSPASPMPEDCYYLPEHSWGLYNQDGTVDIGVEASFLAAVSEITGIDTPGENDLIEQGYTGFKLKTSDEVHGVFMPFSGRVVQVNEEVLENPGSIDAKKWVLKIVPSQVKEETTQLMRRPKC